MKITKKIIIFLILIIAFQSCKTTQESATIRNIDNEIISTNDNSSLFIDANKQKILGNYNEAIKIFNKCIKKDPDDAASRYELAKLYLVINEKTTALEQAEKAFKIDPENKWYGLILARLYIRNANYKKSTKIYKMLIKNETENLDYFFELASAYLFTEDYQKAIDAYNEIEKKLGINERISFQKKDLYIRAGKIDKAINEIKKLINAFPKESRYYSILAEFYLSNNMEEKGLEAYKKIVEIDPQNEFIHISLSDYYRKTGDNEKAFEELKLGFKNPALNVNTKIQILTTYYTVSGFFVKNEEQIRELTKILINIHPENSKPHAIMGDLYYQKEDYKNAHEEYLKVIRLDSSNYFVWEQILFTESKLNDYKAMVKESARAIELFPQQPILYLFSGLGNYQLRNFEAAIKSFEFGVQFVIDNNALKAQFYSYIGDTYHELKNNKKSDEAYEKVLVIEPENSLVLNNYAYYLSLRNERLEKAEEMSKKSIELDKENSSNLDTYAWILYKLNKFEDAKTWIEKAIQNGGGESAVVLEHFGDILYKLNNKEEAFKIWEEAKSKGQGSVFLDKKIKDKKLYE
ncbi:MAG: tetratricopeptide repeat protein [Bacteroidales bacterium]|nr:tetratricopeptide repeat protein [Bacteroidales bacterium]